MTTRLNNEYIEQISRYIKAKDSHKPHLITQVFTEDATLTMQVVSGAISFPEKTVGREAIAYVLVKDFNQKYEDIYTFCLEDTLVSRPDAIECRWLVCMRESQTGGIKIGVGRYYWEFQQENVKHLNISIDAMILLPISDNLDLLSWADGLSYPWVESTEILSRLPKADSLNPIHDQLMP